jgi:hypothetical protein
MKRFLDFRVAIFAIAILTLVAVSFAPTPNQTASAESEHPVVEIACGIFGIPAEECPTGALVIADVCAIDSTSIPQSPSSKLETYEDYLDLNAIYASGPDFGGDGRGELVSGVNAPGGIRLIITPGGKLEIQCSFDVSEYLLPDRPNKALVTEFLCGPPFNPATHGNSRLTKNGILKINCHVGNFPG